MGKQEMSTNFFSRLLVITIFIVLLSGSSQSLSDKRLCADENCKEIISLGTGKINYRAGEDGMVSFKINSPIRIKSKSAGKDPSVWGVEVNGREGYAPKELIRETKIYISEKDLKYEVDVVKASAEVPILSTSENYVAKVESLETTTTKPLPQFVPTESVEKLPTSATEVTKIERATEATPVLMELVDGTQVPKIYYSDIPIESGKEDGAINLNQKKEINADGENIENDVKKELNNEEKEEGDQQPTQQLDKSNSAKPKANILPTLIEEEIETESAQEDARKEIAGEELQVSSAFNDKFINNQEPSESSEESEVKKKQENTQKQVSEVNRNKIEEKLILTSSSTGKTKPENHKYILENENNKKLQEKVKNDNRNNEYKNEKEAEEEIEEKVNNSENTLETGAEASKMNNKNDKDAVRDLTESNESYNENLITNQKSNQYLLNNNTLEKSVHFIENASATENENKAEIYLKNENESISNNFDDSLKLNNVPYVKNTVNYENDTDLINANGTLQEDLENIPKPKNNFIDGNIPLDNNYSAGNTPNVINNSFVAEQDLIYTTTVPPQVVVEESTSEINTESLDHQSDSFVAEQEIIYTTTVPPQIVVEESTSEINTESLDHQNDRTRNTEQEIIYTTTTSPQIVIEESTIEINTESLNHQNDSFTTEQEIIYTTTISPQMVIEESTSDIDVISQQQMDNQKEENYPQTKEDSFSSSNSFTESSTNMHLSSQDISIPTEVPHNSFHEHDTSYYDNAVHDHSYSKKNSVPNLPKQSPTVGYTTVEPLLSDTNKDIIKFEEKQKQTKAPAAPNENSDIKDNKGLFATIMGTVKSVLSINKKIKQKEDEDKHELDRILFSKIGSESILKAKEEEDLQYCKQIGQNGDCPHQEHELKAPVVQCDCSIMDAVFNSNLTFDAFAKTLAAKVLEISEVLVFLVIVGAATLFFIFGYYCFCNSSREGALLSKLNQLESSLLASQKENAILKHNLMTIRQKLTSIEDNSFGSNDMVVSLKKDLEEELLEKARLQDQITALQRELENAADAGIELNKIVSELLSNQTGDESIISSVEELQKQLNEQQNTIMEINASLAEKSRENSELQLLLAEQNARYESELAILQRDNDELEHEKGNLLSRLEELKNEFDRDITTALEGKNIEIKRLQSDILQLNNKVESEHTKWQTSLAKVEALEECLKNVRKDPSVNISELVDVANIKAQLIESQRKYKTIKEKLDLEVDARKLAENQLQNVSAEAEKLKQDFNQSEKDKLEAQTRLEVLSNYFKDKENQLQKELSLKEAMWLKQQGETTTTVDRLTAMQEEIQSLKSQNDSLRAEIEAQVAAHKAQIGTLENRAHETWLAARQADRRYDEARAEATALRRKLTALAGGNINDGNKASAGPITLSEDLANVPSPVHMESPGSPMLGRMPPPPFLPPPFMGPPPPFIGMPPPPPPFVPPGEMRPAPLGRIMSPLPQRSGRFSPQHLDYEDYLEYEGNNTWHRHTYSPPPRTYRSLSPTDSRYDYGTERDLMSTYDTETDFSPPPSPRESRRRGNNNFEKCDLLKSTNNAKRFNNKGPLSSGSEKSYNSPFHNDTKTNKGSSDGNSIV